MTSVRQLDRNRRLDPRPSCVSASPTHIRRHEAGERRGLCGTDQGCFPDSLHSMTYDNTDVEAFVLLADNIGCLRTMLCSGIRPALPPACVAGCAHRKSASDVPDPGPGRWD